MGTYVSHTKREVAQCDFRKLGFELRPAFCAVNTDLTELPARGYFIQRSPAHLLAGHCCEDEFDG